MTISVISHNTARSNIVNQTILEIARARQVDILLVQEPFIFTSESTQIPTQHFDYLTITNNIGNTRPRAITYIRKESKIEFTNRTDLVSDPDAVLLEIRLEEERNIYLLNLYNEKDNLGTYTITRSLKGRVLDRPFILAGDMNAHHRWWNSRLKRPRNSKDLVEWVNLNRGSLLNTPDLTTFSRKGCQDSVIDLVFTNTSLAKDWHLLDDSTGSDHEILAFNITTTSSSNIASTFGKYDFKKADWLKFSQYLERELDCHPFFQSIDYLDIELAPRPDLLIGEELGENSLYSRLDTAVASLTSLLERASDQAIPKIRLSSRSKPW